MLLPRTELTFNLAVEETFDSAPSEVAVRMPSISPHKDVKVPRTISNEGRDSRVVRLARMRHVMPLRADQFDAILLKLSQDHIDEDSFVAPTPSPPPEVVITQAPYETTDEEDMFALAADPVEQDVGLILSASTQGQAVAQGRSKPANNPTMDLFYHGSMVTPLANPSPNAITRMNIDASATSTTSTTTFTTSTTTTTTTPMETSTEAANEMDFVPDSQQSQSDR